MPSIDIEAILKTLTGNDTVNQIFIYQLVGQVVAGLTSPLLIDLQQAIAYHFPNSALSPADAATAVVRGYMSAADGEHESQLSGIDAQRFDLLTKIAGAPPAPGALAEALRRTIIPLGTKTDTTPSYMSGIAEGDTADKWADMYISLSTALPGPSLAVDAAVRGQLSQADGEAHYKIFGGDPTYYQLYYDTTGNPPSPLEAAQMARRGIIAQNGLGPGETTFQQAVAESGYKNKWEPIYWALSEYHPPPRTVTAMYNEGQLNHDDALKELIGSGLSPTLAAAYLQPKSTNTASKPHQLAVSTIEKLYTDQVIDGSAATQMLEAIGYSQADAQFYLEIMDLAITESQVSTVISRVRTLYIGHKINEQTALNTLSQLQIPGKQLNGILTEWRLARDANYVNLTAATIAGGMKYGIITPSEAQTSLEQIGYTPYDAWLFLSEHMHGAIGPAPAPTTINPGSVG